MNKIAFFLALLVATPLLAQADHPLNLTIEGAVVCADQLGGISPATDRCPPGYRYGLRTDQGKVYLFLDEDPRAEIFHDARVRARRLRISGWGKPGNRIEIIKLQSVRDGKLYDIFYYCQTCNITQLVGGPCPCCQAELEFREEPAKQ